MPPQSPYPPRIKWNKVTWYSKLGAIVLLLGVVPALSFYIGTQYQGIRSAPLGITTDPIQPSSPAIDTTYDPVVRQDALSSVEWGTSFGMCGGYCYTKMIVTASTTTVERWSHQTENKDYPPIHKEYPTSKESWNALVGLVQIERMQQLPDRIGCPDCDDGGTEWTLVKTNGASKKVEYDYESPPSELKALAEKMRALYKSLLPNAAPA